MTTYTQTELINQDYLITQISKSRAMRKDEVMLLLDLISKHSILTSKTTNATNNKLKEEAWKSISKDYTAMAGELRRPETLRLKWENLKKAARKRHSLRQKDFKTDGFIYGNNSLDEALDRVISILSTTYTSDDSEVNIEVVPTNIEVFDVLEVPSPEAADAGEGQSRCSVDEKLPKKTTFYEPFTKRRKISTEAIKSRIEKDVAITEYFRAKTEKVNLENIKLKLEIERMMKKGQKC